MKRFAKYIFNVIRLLVTIIFLYIFVGIAFPAIVYYVARFIYG
nr:MAG TPA: hypothetical protein [Caudoviricetes sp.]